MPKYTKYLQFTPDVKKQIYIRDQGQCIFCAIGYHMDCKDTLALTIKDVMHYIPKSKQGLGIEENGALGCRYHHSMMDNGNQGVRKEMLDQMREYLKGEYPAWEETELTYHKYNF